jgi:tetratricopeptide (TPR) repeat protein
MGLLDMITKHKPEVPAIDLSEVYDASIKDLPEPRPPGFDKVLAKAVRDYTASDNVRRTEIFQFEEAKKREPDFFLPYYWIATHHMKYKNYAAVIETLQEGIRQARTKSVLCRRLGECYFSAGDMEKAVYWFCTAVMAGDQTDFHVYLYLGYIYEAYGMKNASYWARRRARGISYQMTYMALEYVQQDMERIIEVARQHRTERVQRMLAALYPFAKKKLGHL